MIIKSPFKNVELEWNKETRIKKLKYSWLGNWF